MRPIDLDRATFQMQAAGAEIISHLDAPGHGHGPEELVLHALTAEICAIEQQKMC